MPGTQCPRTRHRGTQETAQDRPDATSGAVMETEGLTALNGRHVRQTLGRAVRLHIQCWTLVRVGTPASTQEPRHFVTVVRKGHVGKEARFLASPPFFPEHDREQVRP